MTDELRALDLIYHEVGDTKEARDAYEFLSARLRGEAVQQSVADTSTNETWIARAESKLAQGKQQAVAWVSPEQLDALRRGHDSVSAAPHKWRTDLQTVPLYTRPHPVAVAGDAMCVRCGDKPEGADSLNLTLSGLVTYGRVAANPAQGASRWHLMDLVRQMVPHLEAALSTQPAPSEQVAARQINREFVEGVKQLCRDYSCRQNRPYMGDVFAQLDYLAEQLDMTVAPSEQVAASVAVPDWQPIETAPRDGTEILAWDGEDRIVTHWCKFRDGFGDPYEGWIHPNIGELGPSLAMPTHWQTLAAAPVAPALATREGGEVGS